MDNLKRELRNVIRTKAEALGPDYRLKASEEICDKVLSLEKYRLADTVFCFAGTGYEPDTMKIIKSAISDGKTLCVPLCTGSNTMEARVITDPEADLRPGMYGISEPADSTPAVMPSDIDFAVIPCVTCDLSGRRLGHGRGYYDRYLSMVSEDFTGCVICFDKLVSEEIPVDKYDVPMEFVVTEKYIGYNKK